MKEEVEYQIIRNSEVKTEERLEKIFWTEEQREDTNKKQNVINN